jgi:hemerythrin-like domain-containing protein
MTHIIEELRREHRNHTLLLNILEHQVGQMERGLEADFDLVNEVMDYFVTYPDFVHHPKEELVLEHLVKRDPSATALLRPMQLDHAESEAKMKAFNRMVEDALGSGVVSKANLCEAARDFILQQRQHMSLEETVFFPAALRTLQDEDWEKMEGFGALRHAIDRGYTTVD